jgi:hypothetical protein
MDPTKKELYTDKRASGLATGDADLTAAVENFKGGTTNWIGNKIVNNKALQLHSTGSGGIRELLASLTDDDVYFCGVKAVLNNQQKVFHLGFVGPNTSGMKKGKATMQKNAAFSVIDAHGELWYDCDLEEITEDKLIQDIARLMSVSIEQVQLV